jgi:hypothetical protein
LYWSIIFRKAICFHQVCPGKELVGGIDALQILAGDALEYGKARAVGDKDCVESLLFQQFGDGVGLPFISCRGLLKIFFAADGVQRRLLDDDPPIDKTLKINKPQPAIFFPACPCGLL